MYIQTDCFLLEYIRRYVTMLFHQLRPVQMVVVSRFVAITADGPQDVPSYSRPVAPSKYVPTMAAVFKDGNDGNNGIWS